MRNLHTSMEPSLSRHSVYCHFIVGTTEPAEQAPVDTTPSTHPSTSFQPPPLLQPPTLSPSHSTEEFQAEIRADVAVVKALQELETLFYHMIVQVKQCLEELECDLSVARLFLDGVTGTEDFSSCGNFCKVMELLQRNYIDIFNTSILQGLIACFKKDGLTKLVQAYEKEK